MQRATRDRKRPTSPRSKPSDLTCVRLEIRGRVQGVWFRGSAQEQAERLVLAGWARNRPDGSVEIVAQGAPASIEEFVSWCDRGPPGARVSTVTRSVLPVTSDLEGFRIRS